MSELSLVEKEALGKAAEAFAEHGIDFSLPWDGDMDDLERERYGALVKACRAYYLKVITG